MLSKSRGQSVHSDRQSRSRSTTGIACQSLCPAEPPMSPLCPGQHGRGPALCFLHIPILWSTLGHCHGLGSKQSQKTPADLTAFPISPEDQAAWWRGKGLLSHRRSFS